ncbi:hypothetical protein JXA12_04115 [Candidatus Woesearchaeota archaeon]|nr:hypothetical protein [Candidatus Woesearchaeota archaeon]
MDEGQEFDPARFQALEEVVYHTSHVLEMVMQLLVDKGYFTEEELVKKMEEFVEHEDTEEVGYDADAPRDRDE